MIDGQCGRQAGVRAFPKQITPSSEPCPDIDAATAKNLSIPNKLLSQRHACTHCASTAGYFDNSGNDCDQMA